MKYSLQSIIDRKKKVIASLEKILSEKEKTEVLKDHHARRKPRPCGMTVHTGIGCNLRCIYCYIKDMGFDWSVKPYPLNPLQMAYALAINPFFVPGSNGSLVALGSVTEPFLVQTKNLTFNYINAISKYLGNPIQFSTKMYLSTSDAVKLKNLESGISPLITIITLKKHKLLEPYAPNPMLRLKTISNLAKAGLKPILFYRPIIPGINDNEYVELLSLAKEYGAKGVVLGGIRVTQRILENFRSIGLNTSELIKRLIEKPIGNKQVSVRISDIKKKIMKYAERISLVPMPMACMANLYTHGKRCWLMEKLGVGEGEEPIEPDFREIKEFANEVGLRIGRILFNKTKLVIEVNNVRSPVSLFFAEAVKCYYRVCTYLKKTIL